MGWGLRFRDSAFGFLVVDFRLLNPTPPRRNRLEKRQQWQLFVANFQTRTFIDRNNPAF